MVHTLSSVLTKKILNNQKLKNKLKFIIALLKNEGFVLESLSFLSHALGSHTCTIQHFVLQNSLEKLF